MTIRMRVELLVVLCMAFVGAAIGLRGQAQVQPQPFQLQQSNEGIISGADLGFRVEGRKGSHITGTLMVRINGKWVPVNGPGTFPLHSQ